MAGQLEQLEYFRTSGGKPLRPKPRLGDLDQITTRNHSLGLNRESGTGKELIAKAMERANGVIGRAAQLLGMSYKTLQYRLEKFGIEKPGKRRVEP